MKQFAKRMGQPNFGEFEKWKTVWVAGFLEKKHQSIIPGQNRLQQLQDGPLHCTMPGGDFLETFRDVAALGKLQQCGMDSATID
jgi:hypothetical protein